MPYQCKIILIRRSYSTKLICKITEPRNQMLKVEILHEIKEFCENILFILISFYKNLGIHCFNFPKIALFKIKCQIAQKK